MGLFEVEPWEKRSFSEKLITGVIVGPFIGVAFTLSLIIQANLIGKTFPTITNIIPPFKGATTLDEFDNLADFTPTIKLGIVVICTLHIIQILIAYLLFSRKGVCIKRGFKMIMVWTWFFSLLTVLEWFEPEIYDKYGLDLGSYILAFIWLFGYTTLDWLWPEIWDNGERTGYYLGMTIPGLMLYSMIHMIRNSDE